MNALMIIAVFIAYAATISLLCKAFYIVFVNPSKMHRSDLLTKYRVFKWFKIFKKK